MQDLLMQLMTAFATALVGVLLVAIPIIGTKVTSYLSVKKDAEIIKKGVDKYNAELEFAKSAWWIVDEHFRLTPMIATVEKIIEAKINMFSVEILKKVPYLSASDIDHLRQALAGEINQIKEVIVTPAIIIPVDAPKQDPGQAQ